MTIDANTLIVTAKSQAAVGTVEPITLGTDPSFRALEVSPSVRGEGLIERLDLAQAYGPGLVPVRGSMGWQVQIVTELYSWDDLTSIASCALAPLFAGSGYLRAAPAPNRIELDLPTSHDLVGAGTGTGVVPFTLQIDQVDGNRITMFDCVTTWQITADAGARPRITWTIQGRWYTDPAASPLVSPVAPSSVAYASGSFTDPLPWINDDATLTVPSGFGTWGLAGLASWTFGFGAVLVERPDAQNTHGFAPSYLSRADAPTLSVVIDAEAEGALDAWTDALAVNSGFLSLALPAPGGGQTLTIGLANAYARIPESQGDAFSQYGITFAGAVDETTGTTSTLVWS